MMMADQRQHPTTHFAVQFHHSGADSNSTTSSSVDSPNRTTRRRSRRHNYNKHKQQQPQPRSPATKTETSQKIFRHNNTMAWGNDEAKHLEEALATVTAPQYSSQEEDDNLRQEAVDHLEKLLAKWTPSQNASSTPINPWNRIRPTLVTFGSYRLGVHRADSDLDLLALCPPEYSRADFFQSWVALLQDDAGVSKIHPIPGAYTPVIKFYYMDTIQVDMLFARVADGTKLRELQQRNRGSPSLALFSGATSDVNRSQATTSGDTNTQKAAKDPNQGRLEYIIDDTDLKDQDEAGVRSLNGARVTQMLLEMVPDLVKFRTVLRAVKEWAVAKGIYSNVLGFLGGVNFAILVAFICREHPKEDPPMLLFHFFRTFSVWRWPNPVMLLPIQSKAPEGAPEMPAWDPERNPRDGLHVMPIVTPAYPSMNSTYNCGQPQLRRIREEFAWAANLMANKTPQPPLSIRSQEEEGSLQTEPQQSSNKNVFSKLFEPSSFFSRHEHFLQITIRASNESDYLVWFRLVESRLRLLIANLDTPELHVWPYSHEFERKYDAQDCLVGKGRSARHCTHESLFYIALHFSPGVDNNMSLVPYTSDFLHKINTWSERKEGMDLSVAEIQRNQLPDFIRPKKTTTPAPAFKENRGSNQPHHHHQQGNNNNSYSKQSRGNRQPYNGGGGGYHAKKNVQYNRNNTKKNNSGHRQQHQHYRGNYNGGGQFRSYPQAQGGVCHAGGPSPGYYYHHNMSLNNYDNQGGSVASSDVSYERAETEETQSMASDVSFSESISSSSSSTGGSAHAPVKRICVVGSPTAPAPFGAPPPAGQHHP